MILAITNKCSSGCTHCLSDCRPVEEHITIKQFKDNLEWCMNLTSTQPIIISGGEPFEHPDIREILTITLERCQGWVKIGNVPPTVIVATNGIPLLDDPALYDWYKEFLKKAGKFFLTQVTNVPKYYPRKFTEKEIYWLSKLKGCSVIADPTEIALYPQGRALDLNEEYQTRGPKCINARLVSKQLCVREAFPGNATNNTIYSLFNLISSQAQKFCSPRVNIDGTISIGESLLCPPIGTINDHPRKLFLNILNCNCEKCKISIDKLKETNPMVYDIFRSKMEGVLK